MSKTLLQKLFDGTAISLSLCCLLHCILLPLIVVALPVLGQGFWTSEYFHQWMLVPVSFVSGMALYAGYRSHKHFRVISLAAIALSLMTVATFEFMHHYEIVMTIIGVSLLAVAHIINWRFSRRCAVA